MKQQLITDYFYNDCSINKQNKIDNSNNLKKIIYGYNSKTNCWHCTMCGIDMGENNPRQLCKKTWCPNL
jgi:hypothetical protein